MLQSPHHVAEMSPSTFVPRRTALRALTGMGLLLAFAPLRSLAQRSPMASSALMVGDIFVGVTSDLAAFVAVVVRDDQAIAYLCDGEPHQTEEWFSGSLRAGRLKLMAETGAEVLGMYTPAGIMGGAHLDDGRGFRFRVLPATDVAGLYTVRMLADGGIQGESSTGAVLDGEVISPRLEAPQEYLPSLDSPAEGQILGIASQQVSFADGARFAVRITLPDGRVVPMVVRTATAKPGQFTLILWPNGTARGQVVW